MSNSYFEFKQFRICQDGAAMKVGTDGVLLGAWMRLAGSEKRILDIGTGTGLIALMAAQRAPLLQVDAVEMDLATARQAQENARSSPWSERIRIYNISVKEFGIRQGAEYDHIVSNPPFFVDSLKAPDASRAAARHTDTLSFGELVSAVVSLLNPRGRFSVIYPVEEAEKFIAVAAEAKLFCRRKTKVRGVAGGPVKRVLMEFSRRKAHTKEDQLVIELGRHHYSDEYIALTKDFYLKF